MPPVAALPAPPASPLTATFERFHAPLLAYATRILHDPEGAEDVVQETFLRALREPAFNHEGFYQQAWLYRVTRNRCLNQMRDARLHAIRLHEATRDGALQPAPSGIADAFVRIAQGQSDVEVLHALDGLSEAHRRVLMLRYHDDMSYLEIAEELGVPIGTVMSRIHRAHVFFRDALNARAARKPEGLRAAR